MALQLKISVASFDRVTHVATITDDTGVFNNPNNLGGYGAPNPERNTLALVISTTRNNSGEEDVQWSDPLTDTVFTNKFESDGVFDIRLAAIEFETGAFDPNLMTLGRVFYSVQDDLVYKVAEGSGGNQIVQTTTDVKANALHISEELKDLTKSYAENKKVLFWCEEIGSCFERPYHSEEFLDISKVIESMECNFEDECFIDADDDAIFSDKIKKFKKDESVPN